MHSITHDPPAIFLCHSPRSNAPRFAMSTSSKSSRSTSASSSACGSLGFVSVSLGRKLRVEGRPVATSQDLFHTDTYLLNPTSPICPPNQEPWLARSIVAVTMHLRPATSLVGRRVSLHLVTAENFRFNIKRQVLSNEM